MTRSSSACPMISARVRLPSSSVRISRSAHTSPMRSYSPASTTVSASLSRRDCPRVSSAVSTAGDTATRMRRPEVNTSTVESSWATRKTP